MSKDTIAGLITAIRNADMDKKRTVRVASTKITETIVKILLQEGFIENVRTHRESHKNLLVSTLRHRRNRKGPYRTILKRISRPDLRIYSHYHKIPRILGGDCNSFHFSRYNDRLRDSIRKNRGRNFVLYMVIFLVSAKRNSLT